jgi:hypothetical protein
MYYLLTQNHEEVFDFNRLNKENIPPNHHANSRVALKDKTNRLGNEGFLKRTHSMDIQQKPHNSLGHNMMNIEPIENLGPKFSVAMETEDVGEFDTFDKANRHNPQMVSVFAKQIFEYLRDKEVQSE